MMKKICCVVTPHEYADITRAARRAGAYAGNFMISCTWAVMEQSEAETDRRRELYQILKQKMREAYPPEVTK